MNFFISDTHFGHENIMRLCNRPFKSVEEMDEVLIKNWNATVSKDDTVYILGDFCYKSGRPPQEYLEKLNGHKILIVGNHDGSIIKNIRALKEYFDEITSYKEIYEKGTQIILCHYPMAEWNGFFHDSIHLYGHIHNNTRNDAYKIMSQIANSYNVGADILEFAPQTLDNVIKLNKEFNRKYLEDITR